MFLDQTLTGSLCKFQITGKEVEWLRRSNALLGRPESETPNLERNTWTDEKPIAFLNKPPKPKVKRQKHPKNKTVFFKKNVKQFQGTTLSGLASRACQANTEAAFAAFTLRS